MTSLSYIKTFKKLNSAFRIISVRNQLTLFRFKAINYVILIILKRLLERNPEKRIGVKDKNEIKNHPFFKGIEWDKVLKKEYPPPEFEMLDLDENLINTEVDTNLMRNF